MQILPLTPTFSNVIVKCVSDGFISPVNQIDVKRQAFCIFQGIIIAFLKIEISQCPHQRIINYSATGFYLALLLFIARIEISPCNRSHSVCGLSEQSVAHVQRCPRAELARTICVVIHNGQTLMINEIHFIAMMCLGNINFGVDDQCILLKQNSFFYQPLHEILFPVHHSNQKK